MKGVLTLVPNEDHSCVKPVACQVMYWTILGSWEEREESVTSLCFPSLPY